MSKWTDNPNVFNGHLADRIISKITSPSVARWNKLHGIDYEKKESNIQDRENTLHKDESFNGQTDTVTIEKNKNVCSCPRGLKGIVKYVKDNL